MHKNQGKSENLIRYITMYVNEKPNITSRVKMADNAFLPKQESTSWWRHQMETFSALLAICAGNSPVPGEFPTQRPVTRSFDVFFDLRLNKRLSKQSRGRWLQTLSRPLWRHCNVSCEYLFVMQIKFPVIQLFLSWSLRFWPVPQHHNCRVICEYLRGLKDIFID